MTTKDSDPTNVNIDSESVKRILDALRGLTDVIAGRSAQDARQPSAEQARVIIDYETLSALLGRPGRGIRLVSARRTDDNKIEFPDGVGDAEKVAVTPRRGTFKVYDVGPVRGLQQAQLTEPETPRNEPLVRVELQTATGIPVALCPRLPAVTGVVVT